MAGMPEPSRVLAAEPDDAAIVTKLTQLVRITEQVRPDAGLDGTRAVLQIAQMAHSLIDEVSAHLKRQDRRIAELENLATTDALTRVFNRRGFEEALTHELSVAR